MWSFDGRLYQDMELFQLWINLPGEKKAMAPSIQLAGGEAGGQSKGPIPVVTVPSSSSSSSSSAAATTVRVVMGEAHGVRSPMQPWSPMSVLHCTCEPGARWEYSLPAEHSLTLYARRGPLDVVVGGGRAVRLRTFETAFFKVLGVCVCGHLGGGGVTERVGESSCVVAVPPKSIHTHVRQRHTTHSGTTAGTSWWCRARPRARGVTRKGPTSL